MMEGPTTIDGVPCRSIRVLVWMQERILYATEEMMMAHGQ